MSAPDAYLEVFRILYQPQEETGKINHEKKEKRKKKIKNQESHSVLLLGIRHQPITKGIVEGIFLQN